MKNWRTTCGWLGVLALALWLGGCGSGPSPKLTIAKMIDTMQREDEPGLRSCFTYSDDLYRRMVDACSAEVIAERKLEQIIRERFGDIVADESHLNFSDHALYQLKAELADAEVAIEGKNATVAGPPTAEGRGLNMIKLKKAGGQWKIDAARLPSVAEDAPPETIEAFIAKSHKRTMAMDALSSGIQDGGVSTLAQLGAALGQNNISPPRPAAVAEETSTQP